GEEAFALASLSAQAVARRLRRTLLAVAFLVLALGTVVFFLMNRTAHRRMLALYEEQGRQASLADDPMGARAFLGQARAEGIITVASYSPDGKRILTASEESPQPILWDAATGQAAATLEGHRAPVRWAVHGPDGLIATASVDKTAIIWSGEGTLLRRLEGHQ